MGPVPIFRSDAQARILAWLLLDPRREQPIATLAPIAGVAQPNALREVNRLVSSGLLVERRAGNTRLVRANPDNPYFEPLVQILGRAYGPTQAIPRELAPVTGIDLVVLVGSWARRFSGEAGPPPRDIDVVVVGSPDRRALRRANALLEESLGMPVQFTVVSREEWQQRTSGFVQDVRDRPHLVLSVDALPETSDR